MKINDVFERSADHSLAGLLSQVEDEIQVRVLSCSWLGLLGCFVLDSLID